MDIFSDIETSQAALAFVLGGILFLSGALLIVTVVRQYLSERGQSQPDSLLAPVLAADTLIPRLRVVWVKSMLVEAEAVDGSAVAAGRLAREIRRCTVWVQAKIVAGEQLVSAELERHTSDTLSRAIELVRGQTRPEVLEALRQELAQTRTALGESPRAAEPDASVAEGPPHPITD